MRRFRTLLPRIFCVTTIAALAVGGAGASAQSSSSSSLSSSSKTSISSVSSKSSGKSVTSSGKSASRSSSSSVAKEKLLMLTCLRAAVATREAAIVASLDAFGETVKPMLELRSKRLDAAWAYTDDKKRQDALKAVWRNFGTVWRKAGNAMRSAKRDAWEQYRDDRSDCGMYQDEEGGGLGLDSQF